MEEAAGATFCPAAETFCVMADVCDHRNCSPVAVARQHLADPFNVCLARFFDQERLAPHTIMALLAQERISAPALAEKLLDVDDLGAKAGQ